MENKHEKYTVFKCGIGILVLVNDHNEFKVIDVKKVRGFKPNGKNETFLELRRRDRAKESYCLTIDSTIENFAHRFSLALKNCS